MGDDTRKLTLLVTFDVAALRDNLEGSGITSSQRAHIDANQEQWTEASLTEAVAHELRGVLALLPHSMPGADDMPRVPYAEATLSDVEPLSDEPRSVAPGHPDGINGDGRVETSAVESRMNP
jgi:hypothetical protein